MLDFLKEVIELFNGLGIQYMLSGSLAYNFYGIPRSTRDIDIVADITLNDLDKFVSLVHDKYYYSLPAIKDAVNGKTMFNIIHFKSGYKLDVIVLKNHPYEIHKFHRRRTISIEDMNIDVITVEDLVISKLLWIQELESELQKRDIIQMLGNDGIDLTYIKSWSNRLKLNTYGLF